MYSNELLADLAVPLPRLSQGPAGLSLTLPNAQPMPKPSADPKTGPFGVPRCHVWIALRVRMYEVLGEILPGEVPRGARSWLSQQCMVYGETEDLIIVQR